MIDSEVKKQVLNEIAQLDPAAVDPRKTIRSYTGFQQNFSDLPLNDYVGPDSKIIQHLSDITVGYNALYDKLIHNRHNAIHIADCTEYGLRQSIHNSEREAFIFETDRVRKRVVQEVSRYLPSFSALESFCVAEQPETPFFGTYSLPISRITYLSCDLGILDLLSNGKTAILDGTNFLSYKLEQYQTMAKITQSTILYLWCWTTEEDVQNNIEMRKSTTGWSEADETIRSYYKKTFYKESEEELRGKILRLVNKTENSTFLSIRTRDKEGTLSAIDTVQAILQTKPCFVVPVGYPLSGKTTFINWALTGTSP